MCYLLMDFFFFVGKHLTWAIGNETRGGIYKSHHRFFFFLLLGIHFKWVTTKQERKQ
jgi:hypothetical protein